MCGCLPHAPYWGPGLQPRHVPWLGIEPAAPWSTGWHSIHWATLAKTKLFSIFKMPPLFLFSLGKSHYSICQIADFHFSVLHICSSVGWFAFVHFSFQLYYSSTLISLLFSPISMLNFLCVHVFVFQVQWGSLLPLFCHFLLGRLLIFIAQFFFWGFVLFFHYKHISF